MTLRKHRQRFPDGLEHAHLSERGVLGRHASPVSALLLGAFPAVALAGFFGGGLRPAFTATSDEAFLSVNIPTDIRTGLYFEPEPATQPKPPHQSPTTTVPPS